MKVKEKKKKKREQKEMLKGVTIIEGDTVKNMFLMFFLMCS